MAKMLKCDVRQMAKKMARIDFTVLTPLEAEKMDGKARDQMAKNAAKTHAANVSDFAETFIAEYIEAVRGVFSNKFTQLRSARHTWQRYVGGMTLDAAQTEVTKLAMESGIRGVVVEDSFGPTIYIRRANREIEAAIYVRFDRNDDEVLNPDDPTQKAGSYNARLDLSWSSSTRSLAAAQANVAAYQDAVTLAAELQAWLERQRITWTWGIPEAIVK